jgi:bisphosphoglycerate-independent phosphoglycerate mutase (AlkP superfamily)
MTVPPSAWSWWTAGAWRRDRRGGRAGRGGILADVAPTTLELPGIEQPEQMTGRSLPA